MGQLGGLPTPVTRSAKLEEAEQKQEQARNKSSVINELVSQTRQKQERWAGGMLEGNRRCWRMYADINSREMLNQQ